MFVETHNMTLVSALVGIALGFITVKWFLFIGSFDLVPWAIAGLLIGFLSKTRKSALLNGSLFGFTLSFIFMVFGYQGNELLGKVPFFVILGVFGGFCGLILSHFAFSFKKK